MDFAPVASMENFVKSAGSLAPLVFLAVFCAASVLMIVSLGWLSKRGFEGTALGSLITPWCTGASNLVFVLVMGMKGGDGRVVLENCLVNNATNLTLLTGLPALLFGLEILPSSQGDKGAVKAKAAGLLQTQRITRLSLLMTLLAALFFTGALWALAGDGKLVFSDGLVLTGIFLFWQAIHVMDVLKKNITEKRRMSWWLACDLLFIAAGTYGLYWSVDRLVDWVNQLGSGFWGRGGLGWLSGWLMVLPNAMMALWYARTGRPDIAYSSQIGDGHICIPLCVGLFALFKDYRVPAAFETAILLIAGAAVVHFLSVLLLGKLPRLLGAAFIVSYGWFLWRGLAG